MARWSGAGSVSLIKGGEGTGGSARMSSVFSSQALGQAQEVS
ncbi:MAG: hypothetical protein OXS32_11255 [Verrucomicrobiales bacterium]|nr:hypothetical protein [Verrucomicrobiales bacterium]